MCTPRPLRIEVHPRLLSHNSTDSRRIIRQRLARSRNVSRRPSASHLRLDPPGIHTATLHIGPISRHRIREHGVVEFAVAVLTSRRSPAERQRSEREYGRAYGSYSQLKQQRRRWVRSRGIHSSSQLQLKVRSTRVSIIFRETQLHKPNSSYNHLRDHQPIQAKCSEVVSCIRSCRKIPSRNSQLTRRLYSSSTTHRSGNAPS